MTKAAVRSDQSVTATVAVATIATVVTLGMVGAGFLILEGTPTTTLLAAISFLMIVGGATGPSRAMLVLGVLVMAAASLQITAAEPLGRALAVNSLMAILCNAIVVIADFSFNARRGLAVSEQAAQGYALSYAVAVLGGVGLSAAVVSVVQSQQWPDWLLLVVAGGLAALVIVALGWAIGFRNRATSPPPPPRPSD